MTTPTPPTTPTPDTTRRAVRALLAAIGLVTILVAIGACAAPRSDETADDGSTTTAVESTAVTAEGRVDLATTEPSDLVIPTTVVPAGPDFGPIGGEKVACKLKVTVPNDAIGFAKDSAAIPADGPALQIVTTILGELAAAKEISVVGHASAEGDPDHNRDLSRRRAEAVRDLILAIRPDAAVVVDGVGSDDPLVPDDGTEASRIPNRRVVISGTVVVCPEGER